MITLYKNLTENELIGYTDNLCYSITMSPKFLIMIGFTIGSFVGGWIPTLFGADMLSLWSDIGSFIGGVAGIYFSYKMFHYSQF